MIRVYCVISVLWLFVGCDQRSETAGVKLTSPFTVIPTENKELAFSVNVVHPSHLILVTPTERQTSRLVFTKIKVQIFIDKGASWINNEERVGLGLEIPLGDISDSIDQYEFRINQNCLDIYRKGQYWCQFQVERQSD